MKTLRILFSAAALIAAVSCNKEMQEPQVNQEPEVAKSELIPMTFTATTTETRTTLNGVSINWLSTDKISVFDGEGNREFTSSGEGATVQFSGEASQAANYYALYPYNKGASFNEANLTASTTLAANQTPTAGTFANGLNINASKSTDNTTFHFTNVLSVAKFTLSGSNLGGKTIKSVKFGSTYPLAGDVVIDYNETITASAGSNTVNEITLANEDGSALTDGTYYFVVLPNPGGAITMTFEATDGCTASISASLNKAFTAGVIKNLGTVQGLTWEAPKYYTKVTSIDGLADGAQYVIGAWFDDEDGEKFYAIPTNPTVNSGKIAGETVTVGSNGIATSDAEGFVWTLSQNGSFWTLSDGTNYLYHSNGGNSGTNLGYGPTASFVWSISEWEQNKCGLFKFAGVNDGTPKDRGLLFNGSVFGGYSLVNYGEQNYCGIDLYVIDVQDERTNVELTFNPANPSAITLGDEFEEPALTVDPAEAASSVVYSVETVPANCATIDAATGQLTISAAGTITVTAAIPAGNADYKPTSASYTLTVNAPAGHGETADDPFTVAEVLSFVNGLTSTPTDGEYYVTGIVTRIADNGQFEATHGNATFFISDDGTEGNEFEAYRVLYLGNRKWKAGDMIIGVGDEVIVCGRLTKYKGQVETLAATGENAYNGYLVSLVKAPYFTANVTNDSIEYTGGNSITLNIGANVAWTASINNGASLKIGDADASASVSGNSDTAVTVIIPQNTAGQTYTISFTTTSDQVSVPDNIQIIQTKQETLYGVAFVAGTDITAANYGSLTYKKPINITIAKGDGTNYGYYSPIRFYTDNTLTINSPFSGVVIKKVEFTVTQAGTMTASSGTYSNGLWLGETTELVLTGGSQTRFSDFTVYYTLDGDLPTLASISIDELPTKTEYKVGDAFDFSGAVVTATYSNNLTVDVTSLVTTDGATVVASAGTNKTVTVSYTEGEVTKTDTFSITVSESSSGSIDPIVIDANTENFPSAYGNANTFTEYTLNGIKYKIQQVYKTGGKLQWRADGNNNGTGTMYNTDAMPAGIKSIVIVYNSGDSNKNHSVKIGSDENPASATAITPSKNGSTYTYAGDGTSSYFVITNGTGAGYIDSITINFD